MPERFEGLCGLLTEEPSSGVWDQILKVFEGWSDESEREVALSYAEAHLQAWPDHLRKSPSQESEHPAWPLVRSLVLRGRTIANKKLEEVSLGHITKLLLLFGENINGFGCLSWFGNVTSLMVRCGGLSLENQDALAKLTKLTFLDIESCSSLDNLDSLAELTDLRVLELCEFGSLENVDGLANLTKLEYLDLSECSSLKNVDGLASLRNLTKLYLSECSSLKNLDGLAKHTRLRVLDLRGCKALENVEVVEKMENLNQLTLP